MITINCCVNCPRGWLNFSSSAQAHTPVWLCTVTSSVIALVSAPFAGFRNIKLLF